MKGRTGRLAVSMALAGALAYSPASAHRAPIVKLRGVGTSDTGLVRFFKFKIDPIHDGCSITDEGCNPRIRDFRCVSKRGDEPCPWDHGIPRQLSRLDPAETVFAPDGWLLDFNALRPDQEEGEARSPR